MKKLKIILLLMFFSIIHMPTIENDGDLSDLINVFKNNELELDQWEVVFREKITFERVEQIFQHLEETQELNKESNAKRTKYTTKHNHSDILTETYEIVVEQDKEIVSHIIKLTSDQWTPKVEKLYKKREMFLKRHYLSSLSKKYICINSDNNAIIKE